MTSTLPYDRRGSYSILHNHLRAYEQARLQKLVDNSNGNEAARAAMKVANLNLQADAARRVQHDSDVTLVNAPVSQYRSESDLEPFYDSDTEGEDDEDMAPRHSGGSGGGGSGGGGGGGGTGGGRMTTTTTPRTMTTRQTVIEVKAAATVVEKEHIVSGKKGKKENKGDGVGGRRKSLKQALNKAAFSAFSGSVPKRRGPEFAIYPI